MSTEKNIHLIIDDISDLTKDLGQEKTKSGMDTYGKPQQNVPATIQNIQEEESPQPPQEQKDGSYTISESCKGQNDPPPTVVEPTKLDKGQVEKSVSKPFIEQGPANQQEKCEISSIPAEKENNESQTASNLTEEVKRQGDGQQLTTNPSGGLEKHEDEKESEPPKDVPEQESGRRVPSVPIDESKREGGNEAETSKDVKKRERRRWFRFTRSKSVESQTNEEQNAKTEVKKEGKHEEKSNSNGCGRYLIAIAVIIGCVLFILGGFFWRIGYAIGGYHEDLSNATACPTLHSPSSDSNATHISVLKALQRMWRNETNELGFD